MDGVPRKKTQVRKGWKTINEFRPCSEVQTDTGTFLFMPPLCSFYVLPLVTLKAVVAGVLCCAV
jgi:hypothetical protein